MTVTLAKLLTDITTKTRNSTTGALDNTKRVISINSTLQDLQDYADWDFTRRQKTFYFIDGVTEYSLENYIGASCQDSDGTTSIPDFKNPYDLRIPNESHSKFVYRDLKDTKESIRNNKEVNWYSVDNDLLIIRYPRKSSILVHNCDSLTADGTISASGGASNLTIDSVTYDEGNGALNFDTVAGTSLVVTFDGFTAKDLTTLQNKSHWLIKAWLPTITNFSSIKLEWGDDVTNNWYVTSTAPAGNRDLVVGKNTFAFRWAGASETGSPTVSSVNWARVTITYSGSTTATDFRLDDLRVGEETEMELDYYSLAMVKDTAGDYQLEFDPDNVTQTDILIGDVTARRTVVAGSVFEVFGIIGGKSERDKTDAFTIYERKKKELCQRVGKRLRRASKVLDFPHR